MTAKKAQISTMILLVVPLGFSTGTELLNTMAHRSHTDFPMVKVEPPASDGDGAKEGKTGDRWLWWIVFFLQSCHGTDSDAKRWNDWTRRTRLCPKWGERTEIRANGRWNNVERSNQYGWGRLGHTESHRGENYAAEKQKCIKIDKRYCLRIHFLPRSVDDEVQSVFKIAVDFLLLP